MNKYIIAKAGYNMDVQLKYDAQILAHVVFGYRLADGYLWVHKDRNDFKEYENNMKASRYIPKSLHIKQRLFLQRLILEHIRNNIHLSDLDILPICYCYMNDYYVEEYQSENLNAILKKYKNQVTPI